ncbi:YceI family protein [Streptomyces sp. NPDC041068]|uniref:YceI family protein n=1 Tax=Streptomyces sp. NPDC041068 TaxID=3155130 RepID=UPI0033D65CEF
MATMIKLGELTGDYVIDTARTRIGLVARHTMGTKVSGRFDEFEGSVHLDGDDPSKSGALLSLRTASIRTGNPQRDDMLRGKFLDADNHPALTFATASVEQVGETSFKVTGDLTVRGVGRPITLDVELTRAEEDPQGGVSVGFKGGAVVNRQDWHVNWNAATALMVGPKVLLELDVTLTRKP